MYQPFVIKGEKKVLVYNSVCLCVVMTEVLD